MNNRTFADHWPDFDGSLWAATAPPGPDLPRLSGTIHTDVAIIGGGYCGLSTALHLAKAGVSCTVLEARVPGYGGSGRNNGHCVPDWLWQTPSEIEERFGGQVGGRMNEAISEAGALVFGLIREHAIQCEAVQSGVAKITRFPSCIDKLKSVAATWQSRGRPVRYVEGSALREIITCDKFVGGVLFEEGGHLNPLAYSRGLAHAVVQHGGTVYSHSPIERIRRTDNRWCLCNAEGEVYADSVVVATNAFPTGLFKELDHAYYSVRALGIATAPYPDDVRRALLPGDHNVQELSTSDWHSVFFFFDPQGHLATGSYIGWTVNDTVERASRSVGRRLAALFPELGTVKFEYHWEGRWEVTPGRLVGIHELGKDLWGVVGFSGRGIPTATAVGKELAAMLTSNDPSAMRLPVTSIPRAPLKELTMRAWHGAVLPLAYHATDKTSA